MAEIKSVLTSFAIILLLLLFLFRGCGSRMDKWREWRNERQDERQERWDERREERESRWDRWREDRQDRRERRKWFGSSDGSLQTCGASYGELRTQATTDLSTASVNVASDIRMSRSDALELIGFES